MYKKIKEYLLQHEKQYELLRYLIGGVLSTIVSLFIYYLCCFILATKPLESNSTLAYVLQTVNSASAEQMSVSSTISWILSTIFAFWINKCLVFRVKNDTFRTLTIGFFQFASSRLLSFLLFEQAFLLWLNSLGIANIVNRLIVVIFVMVFNYIVGKFWVFKKKN